MEEIWKPIKGYEGLYEVSNMGRVKSLDRIVLRSSTPQPFRGKIISQGTQNTGYKIVSLWNKKKRKAFLVHRLVAESFLNKQDGEYIVDHINGIREDNRAANLRWCTQKENTNYPIARKKYEDANPKRIESIRLFHKQNSFMVVQLTQKGEVIKTWDNVKKASKSLGISANNIYAVCIGNRKTAGGFVWKYYKDIKFFAI